MKIILTFFIGVLLHFPIGEIIYGSDDFIEVGDIEADNIDWYGLSKSVAVIIPKQRLIKIDENHFKLDNYTLDNENERLSRNHRLKQQPSIAIGTAFLVSENKMITAGHAAKELKDCVLVFDYQWDSQSNKLSKEIYKKSELLTIDKILLKRNSRNGDYTLFKINNRVKARKALNLSTNQTISGKDLKMISSPDGTPLKLTSKGKVWSKKPRIEGLSDKGYFIHNLDNSGGSSGAPIFDSTTGCVIGIQSGGDENYIEINGITTQVKRG